MLDGRDVLARRGDDQLLLAVDDREEAVVVDRADVAGVEPAVGVDQVGGRLRPLVVAGGHDRPAARASRRRRRSGARCRGRARPTVPSLNASGSAGGGGAAGLGHARRCRRSRSAEPGEEAAPPPAASGPTALPAQITWSRPSSGLDRAEHASFAGVVPRWSSGVVAWPTWSDSTYSTPTGHGALRSRPSVGGVGLLASMPESRTGSSPRRAGRRRTAVGRTSPRAPRRQRRVGDRGGRGVAAVLRDVDASGSARRCGRRAGRRR